jgi:hypothetical protein
MPARPCRLRRRLRCHLHHPRRTRNHRRRPAGRRPAPLPRGRQPGSRPRARSPASSSRSRPRPGRHHPQLRPRQPAPTRATRHVIRLQLHKSRTIPRCSRRTHRPGPGPAAPHPARSPLHRPLHPYPHQDRTRPPELQSKGCSRVPGNPVKPALLPDNNSKTRTQRTAKRKRSGVFSLCRFPQRRCARA